MANLKQSSKRRMKMAERAKHQRELHFPEIDEVWLWHRTQNDGYTTIPRTLPIIMQAIDHQTKGMPAGHTLFCLWARSPDDPLLIIENPITFACEAGFMGERAVDTWRKRMRSLRELGFIQAKRGASGEFHYVLLMNPNIALEALYQQGRIQTDIYSRFIDRLSEIGAFKELEEFHKKVEENESAEAAAAAGNDA